MEAYGARNFTRQRLYVVHRQLVHESRVGIEPLSRFAAIQLTRTIPTNRKGIPLAATFPVKGASMRARGDHLCKKITVEGHNYYFIS